MTEQTLTAPGSMEARHPDTPFVNAWLRGFGALLHQRNRQAIENGIIPAPTPAAQEEPDTQNEHAALRAALPYLAAARQAERDSRMEEACEQAVAFAVALITGPLMDTPDATDAD